MYYRINTLLHHHIGRHMKPHHLDSTSELYKAISVIRSEDEAKQFLLDLCTPMEIQAMADRWRVVKPIKAGKPYRKIYEETGVSVTTIGRVARCLLSGMDGYNLIYKRLEKKNERTIQTPNRNSKKRKTE